MANEGIELEIYSFRDPNLKLDTLEGRKEPKYLEELDDLGGGSFKISRKDPKIVANRSLLQGRNICKMRVDGKIVGAWLLQQRKSTMIGAGERAEEAYELAGEGLLTWLKDAVVYPWGGLGHSTRDKRSFSFASPAKGAWYKDADWITPKAAVTYTKTTGNPWKYQPTNWPSDLFPHARWVWGTANSDQVAPKGNNYFRWSKTFSYAQKCSLYIAADNQYQVYVDGEQIAESDPGKSTTYECQKIDFDVDAGYHVVGIAVNNGNAKVKVQHAGLLAGLVYYSDEVPDTNLGNVTIDMGTNARVHRVGHGLANDDKVFFSSTGQLPEPLSTDRNYYVADRDANSFTLQRTTDGAYIDTDGAQSGTHTLFKAGSKANPLLLSYTGMTAGYTDDGHDAARTHELNAKAKYDALPAGSTDSKASKKQKQQAKTKAAAKTRWQVATSARKVWDKEVNAVNTSQLWEVLPYPTYVPGYSPGEIMLRLISEANARFVNFPTFIHPTFTATQDSNGVIWGDALEWTFDVGKDTLWTVAQKLMELQVSMWIDPATMNFNMVLNRGTDRAGDANAVVFEQGKNIQAASTTAVTKIKNSLLLKTSTGWADTPAGNITSQATYGVIEDVVDYDGKESVVRSLASNVMASDATEEEGADYDIFPTDKFPFVDFYVGDWVSAPNDTGSNVKRRLLSLSVEETESGEPNYSAEFDTIFHVNEDRLNRIMQKIGQKGATGGSGIAAGGQVPAGQSNLLLPPAASALIVPDAPTNTVGYSAATWDSSGQNVVSEAILTWDPVDTATDGSSIFVSGYTIYARQLVDADDPNDDSADDWVEWTTSATTMAAIAGFTPGDTWQFEVAAQSPYGSQYVGDTGDVVTIIMGVPTEPMDPPTKPIVTAKLGVGIVSWDGQLKSDDGSVHAPDPQFREIVVGVSHTAGGPYDYTVGTPITLGGRDCYITGFNVGDTLYAVMRSKDGIGILSDPSEEGNGVIVGVDLGSLTQDLKNNLAATSQAASDAGTIASQSAATAGSALTAAQNAQTAAGTAQTAAQNAQTSANGKNKVVYSTAAAPTTIPAGTTTGDTWYQYTGQNLTGIWRYDGTAYQSQLLTNSVIGTLDAGKITTGSLDSARIAARSISTTQLAITDTTNLLPNPRMDTSFSSGWGIGARSYQYTGTDVPVGGAWVVGGRDNIHGLKVPAKNGDSFYFEFTAKRLAGSASMTTSVWITEADGSDGTDRSPGWNAYSPLNYVNRPVTLIADLGNGWARYQTQCTIDPSYRDVAFAQFYVQINQDGANPDTLHAISDLVWRRAAGGQLIVDGSITANNIGAGQVTAGKLSTDSVYANNIAAGQITTNKIAAGAIDSFVITSAVVRSNNNPGYTGVQMDSSGIHAWFQGNMVFDINANGSIFLNGQINASSGSFSGTVNASSGTFNGTVNATGGNFTGTVTVSGGLNINSGVNVNNGGNINLNGGYMNAWNGGINWSSDARSRMFMDESNSLTVTGGAFSGLRLLGGGSGGTGELDIGYDGSGRIYSMTIYNRTYASSSRTSNTSNRIMVVTSSGTLGQLTAVIDSTYLSTSSRRYKYDIEDYNPGLKVLDLQPRVFKYLEDDRPGVGMIAEELDDAGFSEFVHRDPETGDIETIDYLYFGAALLSLAKAQAAQIKELQDAVLNK